MLKERKFEDLKERVRNKSETIYASSVFQGKLNKHLVKARKKQTAKVCLSSQQASHIFCDG